MVSRKSWKSGQIWVVSRRGHAVEARNQAAKHKGKIMNRKFAMLVTSAVGGVLLLAGAAVAEDKAVDWKMVDAAKVSLAQGLAAAQAKGKPISGKFEMEDGKLQLSIYTASKGKYSEVVVNHTSGKIAKSEVIKDGEDLAHASDQNKATAKAKKSLSSAVTKAVAGNAGYKAVSVVPALEGDKPVAAIVLQNATGTKTVSEPLN
jgi:hypothetical protein